MPSINKAPSGSVADTRIKMAVTDGNKVFNTDLNISSIETHLADTPIHTEDNLLAHLAGVETFTGDKTFDDSVKALFGAGSDLEIFHDGANSLC